ncbi:MAG: 16S rRNA (uracil(1498)-N(3))-methyltransferase [Flavobacteriales bacterium]|nr:16S rRNA (uracil(1498)-N(3))-methyltransferase [Flavobacteriales bacterium]
MASPDMHLFHQTDLNADVIELSTEEAHHATAVLRLAVGTTIGLLDGQGQRAEAELITVGKRGCTAQVISRTIHPPERAHRIHIAVAPTKQMDRLEWFVEKAVEVGVDRLTPIITERSERTKLRLDRLQRVAIAAMKQSQRTWLPVIDEAVKLDQFLNEVLPAQRFFGWCEGEHTSLMQAYTPTQNALVLIGPEGDFTAEEADRLRALGFAAISLGHARLRTETAALTACTWMSLAQQR